MLSKNNYNSGNKKFWDSIYLEEKHKVIINYTVNKKSLPVALPPWLELLSPEENPDKVFLSSVISFANRKTLGLNWISFTQNNYRTYVYNRKENTHAIWYFKFFVNSLWYPLPKMLSLPVNLTKMELHQSGYNIEWRQFWLKKNAEESYTFARNTGKTMSLLNGFKTLSFQEEVLAGSGKGYFLRSDGKTGEITFEHSFPEIYHAHIESINLPWFTKFGYITKEEIKTPHSAIYIPESRLKVYRPGLRSE